MLLVIGILSFVIVTILLTAFPITNILEVLLVISCVMCVLYCYIKYILLNPLRELIKSFEGFVAGDEMETILIDTNEELKILSELIRNVIKHNATSNNDVLTANMKLVYNETKIKSILNNIADALVTFDEEGRLQTISPSAEKMFGYPEKDLLYTSIILLFNDQSYSVYESIIEYIKNRDKDNNSIMKTEFIANSFDGRSFPVEISLSRIPQKIDNKYLTVAVIRDVSQAKKQELEVLLAKKRAEKANEVKNDFLSNMSHEIRTPLSGISSMIELILMTDLSDEQKELFNLLKSSSEAFLVLMSDILDYNNIEANQEKVTLYQVNLRDIIGEITTIFTQNAINKNLNFSSSVAENVPQTILSEHRWLKNIFYHLVNNAIKFTKEGFVSLEVKVIKEEEGLEYLIIRVEDTGIGIDRDDFSKIFLPFSQVDNSDNREYGGTGLGLTIVQKIVDIFNGNINIESEVGSGSIFEVRLPIIKEKNS
jgi:PAS domain S-box-containing protein